MHTSKSTLVTTTLSYLPSTPTAHPTTSLQPPLCQNQKKERCEELAAVLSEEGGKGSKCWVLADEIYERITYDTPHVAFATLPGMFERTMTVSHAVFGVANSRRIWALVDVACVVGDVCGVCAGGAKTVLCSRTVVSTADSFLFCGKFTGAIPLSLSDQRANMYPRYHVLQVNGFSKSHSMTGYRLGYIAAPPIITKVGW